MEKKHSPCPFQLQGACQEKCLKPRSPVLVLAQVHQKTLTPSEQPCFSSFLPFLLSISKVYIKDNIVKCLIKALSNTEHGSLYSLPSLQAWVLLLWGKLQEYTLDPVLGRAAGIPLALPAVTSAHTLPGPLPTNAALHTCRKHFCMTLEWGVLTLCVLRLVQMVIWEPACFIVAQWVPLPKPRLIDKNLLRKQRKALQQREWGPSKTPTLETHVNTPTECLSID